MSVPLPFFPNVRSLKLKTPASETSVQLPVGVAFYAVGKATAQALAQHQIESVVDTGIDGNHQDFMVNKTDYQNFEFVGGFDATKYWFLDNRNRSSILFEFGYRARIPAVSGIG